MFGFMGEAEWIDRRGAKYITMKGLPPDESLGGAFKRLVGITS
jgi:hypothetical protein